MATVTDARRLLRDGISSMKGQDMPKSNFNKTLHYVDLHLCSVRCHTVSA